MQPVASQMLRDVGADEKLFQGFTYSGKRRYIDHTLENVVKILKFMLWTRMDMVEILLFQMN
jgi:hypothetical protein